MLYAKTDSIPTSVEKTASNSINENQKIPLVTVAFTAGLALTPHFALASSIGLNFVNGGDQINNAPADALLTSEVAGAPSFMQTNWNNLGRWGNPAGVNDSTGAPSGVTVAWDATGTWTDAVGNATPDNKLFNGYLDSNGNANPAGDPTGVFANNNYKPLVYLTGLSGWLAAQSATTFSLVVYVDGDTTDGRTGEYWAQSVTGGHNSFSGNVDITSHIINSDTSTFSGIYDQVSNASTAGIGADSGNYIVFEGLTADTFVVRTEEFAVRSPINGLQIVATVVPERHRSGWLASFMAIQAFGAALFYTWHELY